MIQQIHRLILSGFTVDNQSGLSGLRNARDTDNLHLRMIGENPLNPLQWGELQPLATLVDRFFSDLRKFKPDPLSLALYQAPSKKAEAKTLSERISEALLPESNISLEQVYLLEKDIQTLYTDIKSASGLGISWDVEHYGYSKQQFDTWRLNILNLKQELLKKEKVNEQASKDIVDLHKKVLNQCNSPR